MGETFFSHKWPKVGLGTAKQLFKNVLFSKHVLCVPTSALFDATLDLLQCKGDYRFKTVKKQHQARNSHLKIYLLAGLDFSQHAQWIKTILAKFCLLSVSAGVQLLKIQSL